MFAQLALGALVWPLSSANPRCSLGHGEFELARANEPHTERHPPPPGRTWRAGRTQGEKSRARAPSCAPFPTRLPSPTSAPRGGSITCTSRRGGSGRAYNAVTDRARSDVRSPLGSGRRGRALPPQASLGRHGPNSSGRRGPCPPPPRFPRLRTQVSRRPRPRLHGNTACVRDARPGTRSSRSLSAAGARPPPPASAASQRPERELAVRGVERRTCLGRPRGGVGASMACSLLLSELNFLPLLDRSGGSCFICFTISMSVWTCLEWIHELHFAGQALETSEATEVVLQPPPASRVMGRSGLSTVPGEQWAGTEARTCVQWGDCQRGLRGWGHVVSQPRNWDYPRLISSLNHYF